MSINNSRVCWTKPPCTSVKHAATPQGSSPYSDKSKTSSLKNLYSKTGSFTFIKLSESNGLLRQVSITLFVKVSVILISSEKVLTN